MDLNPYARFLGSRDPVSVLESSPTEIAKLVPDLPEEQLALLPPTGGKWSAREILAHLADCELVFGFRLRQTLADDHPTVQPFDQDRWATRYANHDWDSALRLYQAMREWNLQLIEGATEADRARPVTHPERGTMSFWTIVETMAGHDLNHLGQLERLAAPARN